MQKSAKKAQELNTHIAALLFLFEHMALGKKTAARNETSIRLTHWYAERRWYWV